MKWILAILLFISGTAFGQSDDTDKYIWYKFQYGSRMPRFWSDSILKAAGLVKFTGLTSSVDTTTYKPVAIDASGNVFKMSGWPGGGGASGSAGGDLTGTYPNPTIATNAVTDAKFRQSAGLSVVGRSASSTGNVADITASTANTFFGYDGSSLDFRKVGLTNGVTGILPVANGGTGTATPGLIAGTNISSITGTWPNQTINASGGTPQVQQSITGDGSSGDKLRLVNDQTTPTKWRFYGADINDSSKGFHEIEENFVGILYNKNTWSDLSDFTTTMVTASVVSNKIQIAPTTAGIFSCNLIINNLLDSIAYTNLQKWKATFRATIDVVNGTSYGGGIGMKSFNNYGAYNALGRYTAYTGGGEIYLSGGHDSVTLRASTRKLTISASDKVLVTVERDGGYLTTSVRNLTTNSAVIDTNYYYSYSSSPYMPNTGKFAIFAFGGQFTIDSICISSNEVKNARLMIVGNSKMQGYNSTGYAQTTPAMLNSNFKTTVLHAGGSDRTIDVARSLKEILMQRPQQVLLVDLMSNDQRQGGQTAGQIQDRYDSITTVLLNAGIDVYHAPLYESSIDLSGKYAHILATFPAGKILPTYEVMQATGALGGDGVHGTDYGYLGLYNSIVQSYKIYGGNNRYGGSSGGQAISGTTSTIPKFTSSSTIGNSNLTDDGTRINAAIAFRAQGGITLQHTAAGTDLKNWNIQSNSGTLSLVAINDAGSSSTTVMQFPRSGITPSTVTLFAPLTVAPTSGTAFNVTPLANSIGLQTSGTVSGYYIPTNFNVDASSGLFGNYINSNSGSSADAEIAIGTAGGSSGNPFTAYRNSSNNYEWATGQQISSGDYRINNGTFPGMGGTNRFRISSTGAITFNNAYTFPTTDGSNTYVLTTNGSGTVSFQPPASRITSINSMTGPAITISGGTGITTSSLSGDVTIAIDNASAAVMHTIAKSYTPVDNTSTTETDLYSHTIPVVMTSNGTGIAYDVSGGFNDATSTPRIKLYFAGNTIFDSGVLAISVLGKWNAHVEITRVTSSTAVTTVTFSASDVSANYEDINDLTSLDFTTTNVLKITGTATGATGGSGDITAKQGRVLFVPAP